MSMRSMVTKIFTTVCVTTMLLGGTNVYAQEVKQQVTCTEEMDIMEMGLDEESVLLDTTYFAVVDGEMVMSHELINEGISTL